MLCLSRLFSALSANADACSTCGRQTQGALDDEGEAGLRSSDEDEATTTKGVRRSNDDEAGSDAEATTTKGDEAKLLQ